MATRAVETGQSYVTFHYTRCGRNPCLPVLPMLRTHAGTNVVGGTQSTSLLQ
jgi:hypothetical protein